MAEAAVSFVLERLADILDQIEVYKGLHREVERLRAELKRMQCFLKDADGKQEDDERVRNWVSDIRNVAYDAEDAIDTYILKIESHKRRHFIMRYASAFKQWRNRSKIGKDLEDIRVRILDISTSRETYGIRNIGEGISQANERLLKLRRSSPRGQDRDIVGLEDDIATLVAQLVNEEEHQWHALSIVGMGGIGKTTLAKEVYNHADVRACFNCRAWVYVSQEFRTRDILQGIIKQVSTTTKDLRKLKEEELEDMLYEYLQGRRYLVVLDDIWSTMAWDCLAKAFPTGSNGSKLMLTTRNNSVALYADAQSVPHVLRLRSKDDSWKLFCKKTFIDSIDRVCPPQLEEIGGEIVAKCAGLPLAIIILGGLLSRKRRFSDWERILNTIHSLFGRRPNGVSAILALSYIDLPHYLKFCFLYLGLFPEDYLISTHKLFRLWIAEGLIPQHGERMEDMAEDYLNELIDRNMVQVAAMSTNERVKQCRLHDLLRDFAISQAKTEKFLEILWKPTFMPPARSRHYTICSNFDMSCLKYLSPDLRSLLFFKSDDQMPSSYSIPGNPLSLDSISGNFKLLRVLDLEDMKLGIVPSSIGKLIHLKYLGLRHNSLRELPSEIGYLSNLQTLDISANINLRIIPNAIHKMRYLRHLYMYVRPNCGRLRIDTLRHLQTLKDVHVDNWKQNNSANLVGLRKLGLKGSFSTRRVELLNSIANLPYLQSLFLWTEDIVFPSLTRLSSHHRLIKLHLRGGIRKLPSSLDEFPPNLSQLTLHHSRLDQDPMEILEKLPKLYVLRLKPYSYSGHKLAVSTNGFPQLEFLELDFLEFLHQLNVEEGAMPRLRSFRISNCRGLRMLPEEIKFVTTLNELEIEQMPQLFVDRLQGEDFHKVQHVPSVKFI